MTIRVKVTFGCTGPDADVSTDNPLPVTLIGGGGSSGGLTDTELRAAAVPVSGSFYPATQPVSGTFWQTTQPVSGTVSVSGAVAVTGSFYQATQPVSIASMPTTAVTGTFYQATQPVSIAATVAVSGPVTDTQLRASAVPVSLASMPSTPVTGTFWPAAQPVSGTFWQATQPISGSVSVSGSVAVTGTFFQATQPVSIASMPSTAVTGTFWQATQPVSGTVTITPPTLTKGTQGATGVSTQDLKDAGRAIVNAATAIAGVTAVTTEALLTLAVSRDGAATSNVTTIAVTSGKRMRIIGIVAGVISTAAAVISARVSLRMNPSGAAAANSPIFLTVPLSQRAAALAQAGDEMAIMFPEAIEISGAMQVGLSQIASVTTGTLWASLIAYEY